MKALVIKMSSFLESKKLTFVQVPLIQTSVPTQPFANPDDPNSENFGATKAGKYSKVVIEFEVLNRIDMEKRVGTADGAVATEICIDGKWQDITTYNIDKKLSIKNIFTQTRIIVVLENVEHNPQKIKSLDGYGKLQIETEAGKLRPYLFY